MRLYDNYESQAKRFQKFSYPNFNKVVTSMFIYNIKNNSTKQKRIIMHIIPKSDLANRHFYALLFNYETYSIKAFRQITNPLIQPQSPPFCFGHPKLDSLQQTQQK